MKKLIAVLVAAMFAGVTLNAVAADEKKPAKKESKSKKSSSSKKTAEPKK